MREVNGDLFELAANKTLVITTNGFTKADGTAVMGRGCALQAAAKWHDFPKALGERIRHGGNVVNAFRYPGYKAVFTFPVKENWWEKASLDLIRASANRLKRLVEMHRLDEVFIPRPGCGNGKLAWADVKAVLEPIFTDDRFVIVDY